MTSNKTDYTMRLKIMAFLMLVVFYNSSYATGINGQGGGRSAGMSNSTVAVSDPWSVFNNQAGLASLKTASAGFYYENRFLMKELDYKAAFFAYPLREGTFATSISHYGFGAWNESKAGLAYARSFGKYFMAGAQLDYIHIGKEEPYGNRNTITFEAGIISKLTTRLSLGAHIFNPVNASISKMTDEKLTAVLRFGAVYSVSEKFIITAEAEKEIDHQLCFKSGFEYHAYEALRIRAGVNTGLSSFSFGAGINYRKFLLDFSASYHQVLGFSPQSSLTYIF